MDDVPRGTMDEVSSHVRLDPAVSSDGKAAAKIAPPHPPDPIMREGLGADSEEKREPVSDIESAAAVSLKVIDPERPISVAAYIMKVLDPVRPI